MESSLKNSAATDELLKRGAVCTRPGYFLLVTLLVVFVAEACVMLFLNEFGQLSTHVEAFADAVLLSAAIFPLLYFLLFRPLTHLVHDYREALLEVKTLRGLLSICMKCKKIRLPEGDEYDQDSWQNIEQYVQDHSDTEFTHGLCPQCYKEWRKDMGLDE